MGYPAVVLPDAEGVVRAWLRGVDLGPATGRVFFAVPQDPVLPLVTVARAGGAADDDLPFDSPTVIINVWSDTKKQAAAVARLVIAALRSCSGARVEDDDGTPAWLDGAWALTGPTWLPDDEARKARYAVTANLTLRPRAG